MSEHGEVVFLVGAGASVELGIPAMGGMFDAFMQKRKSGLSTKNRKICDMFVNELGVSRDLEEFLLAANTIVDTQGRAPWVLSERVISKKTDAASLVRHREKLREYVTDISDTRKNILNFMAQTCFKFNRAKACDILSGFIEVVADKGYPIYTTNYDFSFEFAAEEKGINVNDNFILKSRRHIWDPKISFPLGSGITIIKLHGSVTWYVDDDGVIEKAYLPTTVNTAGLPVERLVVFPTRFKDIYDQHFFALYSHFLAALSNARCLVVVGHSLRDEYIRAAIIEQVRKNNLRVVVVDPYWPVELPDDLRPSSKGNSGQIMHIQQLFEDFSDELAHILECEVPDQIGVACAKVSRRVKLNKNKLKIKGRIGVLRADQRQTIAIAIDAYVSRNRKPVLVRAWLEARFVNAAGKSVHQFASTFLNPEDSHLVLGLGGEWRQEQTLKVRIPSISNWLSHAEKITLKVALIEDYSGTPRKLPASKIIAEDARELKYSL